MEHDPSDILGHTSLPVAHGKNSRVSSFSMGQSVFISVALLVLYMIGKRLWKRALLWQERSYKLATRRRHGIPDNDLRPFNVAYSAAMMRAREEETRNQVRSNPSLRPQGPSPDRHDAQPEQTFRYRTVPQPKLGTPSETIAGPGSIASKAGPSSSKSANPPTANHEDTFINHSAPRQSITYAAQVPSSAAARPLTRQAAYSDIEHLTSDNEGKKRSLDEQEDDEHGFKKSRVDGEELIDGDEEAEFDEIGHTAPKRGSKRGFSEEVDDGEDVTETKNFREKQARKVCQEKARQSHDMDDNMDIDDEEWDEITELRSRSRGKKRDRAEAGSTFGGDDEDSAAEIEPENDVKNLRRRRKRRTVAKRKSEASHARGKKRERDTDDEKSDQESEVGSQGNVSRKKRGKRGSDRHDRASRSDISMDESINSMKGKVRTIGEEWESNGIKYKVGLNGQRLRQALVKQARQKFVMPVDSQHPDRNLNVQICIECWLTEEEYQKKKSEHMLAWQDGTPPRQEEHMDNLSSDMTEPQSTQSIAGKNLLWGSSTASTPTASPPSHSPANETPPESARPRSYRHSIATTVGLPISPFYNSQIPVKRIASSRASLSGLSGPPGLPDSTNGSPRNATKVFSKWEKQELEAQAIMKIREANRKKELEREAKLKEEKEKAERAAAERARLEKERLDRERAEKDRIEREKAEAENKAKEAAQLPKITLTAPSSENVILPTTSTSTSVPNFFSMGPTQSTASKPVVNTATSQSTSFFSNTPASTSTPAMNLAQAEPTKSQSPFNFSVNSNTDNATTSTSAPRTTAFSFPTTGSSTGGQKAEGSTPSAFNAPLLPRITPTVAPEPSKPISTPSSQPSFSFKPNGLNSMSSNRSQPIQTPAQPNPSTTTSSSTNAPLKFTFNLPNKSAAPSSSATPMTTFPSSSLSGALGSDQPKATTNAPTFNFKIPTTPASASTSANTGSTTPAAATASTPKFSFGSSSFNLSAPSSESQEQNKEPVKSSFGNTSVFSSNSGTGSSPFGANTSFQGQNKEPFKSSFGDNTSAFSASQGQKSEFGGGSTNTTAFSNNTGTTFGQKSGFGGGGTNTSTAFSNTTGTSPSPFGLPKPQTANIFGGSNNSTETSKSVFGNATPTSTTTTTSTPANTSAPANTSTPANTGNTTNTTTTPKFSFSVNNQSSAPAVTTSGTPASGSGVFSLGFGQTPATTTTTTTPQSSPFGAFGNTGGTSSSSDTTTTAPPPLFGGSVFGTPGSQQPK